MSEKSIDPDQRVLRRYMTDTAGRYLIEGEPRCEWSPCRILDISIQGAALEIGRAPSVLGHGNWILLELTTPGTDPVSVHVLGRVRRITLGPNGRTHVGVRFQEPIPVTRAALVEIVDHAPRTRLVDD